MKRKLCGGCLKVKELSEFQKSRTRRIGVQSLCRECANRRQRELRRRQPETADLFQTDESDTRSGARTVTVPGPNGPETVTLPSAPPEPVDKKTQNRCHYRVARAVKMGVLSRPQRCSVCGRLRSEVGMLLAHHEDYNNPLSVVFLCPSCHEIVHTRERVARRGTFW